jgi:hypothetical protein
MNRRGLATVVALALMAGALLWARSRDKDGASRGDGLDVAGDRTGSSAAIGPVTATDASPRVNVDEGDADRAKDVVWKMVDASKARDVGSYLDCFGGELRTRLDASVRELGESGFADYLARRVEELKGVALYDVEMASEGGGASLTVEYVFAAEKELQRLHLEENRGAWRITEADASRREKSLIPYGTPIEQVD